MGGSDPWVVLGLGPGATLEQARAARRRLAKALHPDLHGGRPESERAALAAQMSRVNEALEQIEAWAVAGAAGGGRAPSPASGDARGPRSEAGGGQRRGNWSGVGPEVATEPDDAMFSIDLLPAEAFEALFLVAYGLGDIIVADEPYLLEIYLTDPAPCFCRLRLAPEAGGSQVTVEPSPATPGVAAPSPGDVAAVLVAELADLLAK